VIPTETTGYMGKSSPYPVLGAREVGRSPIRVCTQMAENVIRGEIICTLLVRGEREGHCPRD